MTKKILKGVVTSAKNNKTIVVEVTRKFKHPTLYSVGCFFYAHY